MHVSKTVYFLWLPPGVCCLFYVGLTPANQECRYYAHFVEEQLSMKVHTKKEPYQSTIMIMLLPWNALLKYIWFMNHTEDK